MKKSCFLFLHIFKADYSSYITGMICITLPFSSKRNYVILNLNSEDFFSLCEGL